MFERTELRDGPRVISARLPGARSISIAAYVPVGARFEAPEDAGIAHFLEHLAFKGTASFPTTRGISEAIEGIGGTFNAETDRETTVFWVKVPARAATQAATVLGELVTKPLLRTEDINAERDVIIEEIRSYHDDPAERVQTLMQLALFGDGPLGREICGSEQTVSTIKPDRIRDVWSAAYQPGGLVVAIAGDLDHAAALELTDSAFGRGARQRLVYPKAPPLPAGERILVERRPTVQANLALGLPALRRDHPDQWALELLNAILGDGMSSRLFLEVREERSLAYDVSSGIEDYADAGALVIHAGVDPDKTRPALEAILQVLHRLRTEQVGDEELAKAKAYLGGRLELRMEESSRLSSWIGAQEALHDEVLNLDQALERIESVKAEEIRRLAERLIVDDGLRLAVVGPARALRGMDRALQLPRG